MGAHHSTPVVALDHHSNHEGHLANGRHSQSPSRSVTTQPPDAAHKLDTPRRNVGRPRNDVIGSRNDVTRSRKDVTATSRQHDIKPRADPRHAVPLLSGIPDRADSDHAIFTYMANSVVGRDVTFDGPFGKRQVLYLDYIASGRPLTFIEEYINKEVLPHYANTHTSTSTTARQTTAFRKDARNIIRKTTNATDADAVIFTGSGVTAAIHKLIHGLKFTEPPVVLTGPYEHHSNILPWKELGAEVIRVRQTAAGLIDMTHLEEELQDWSTSGRRLVGSMSAASNVSGILCDVDAVTVMLHRYGALALWDYATAGPYVTLDMNPVIPGKNASLVYKDAMFISPHKFVGGVSTPGLLIAKKNLFVNEVPHACGGGTVLLVRQTGHVYLQDLEEREEGGTPAIVGAIRAGLVFQLKAAITPGIIMRRERELFEIAREAWSSEPNLQILGNMTAERLPIFSFLVHHPATGYYLHHNFVACLLNDLFGIQARGGCACAGPYAMDLLGISEEQAIGIEELLTTDVKQTKKNAQPRFVDGIREIFKPGFTRLNLPYFISEDQLDFVLQAVAMVAEHGWKLLPQYKFNPKTGEWKHQDSQESKQQFRLDQLSYAKGYLECHLPKGTEGGGDSESKQQLRLDQLSYAKGYLECHLPKGAGGGGGPPVTLTDYLDAARHIFADAEKHTEAMADQTHLFDDFAQNKRWFLLPSEANQILRVLSQISSLGPANVFISPRGSGDKQPFPFGDTTSSSGASSGRLGAKTTTTSLGSSGNESDTSGPKGQGPTGNGRRKGKPAQAQKIKVKGYDEFK